MDDELNHSPEEPARELDLTKCVFLEIRGNLVVSQTDDIENVPDLSKGILVENMPEPMPPEGQQVVSVYVDPITKGIIYIYGVVEITVAQRMELLQKAIDDIIMGVV